MIASKNILKMVIVIVIISLLVGCTITEAPVSPTPTLQPFVVTFDGNECTLSGPTEVPPGEYPFFINNQSDLDIPFQSVRYFQDEKTYQDVLELQNEPGEHFAMPGWTLEAQYYFSAAYETNTYILDTIGEHFFYLDYNWKGISFLWLCPPFQVVDVPSK